MTDRLKTWWKGRAPREQKLLLAAGLLALAVLVWLLVVRPLGDALVAARERHDDAVVTLAEVRADVDALKLAGRQGGTAAAGPVDALVSAAATEAGFTVTRIDRPGPGEVTLVMDAVSAPAFFGWVGQMESGRGVGVSRLSVSANADRTLAAQVTFRGAAR